MTTRLLIVRHGNTFNPDETPRRVGCRTDLPLVESGMDQARALGHYIKLHGLIPDYIYASELQRAQQTAMMMMQNAGGMAPVQTERNFNEIDHGPDENKTDDEILARIGKKGLEDWDDYNVVPDGWHVNPRQLQQSWIDFANDCQTTRTGKLTCVVSSGGVIRFAPIILEDGILPDGQSPKVKTASMCLLSYSDDKGTWDCIYWNKRP